MSAYPRPMSDLDQYARAMLNHEGGAVPPIGAEFVVENEAEGRQWWGWRVFDIVTQERRWWTPPPPADDSIAI